ncbi:MAG: GspE/PulE family protein [bacterium]
MSFLNVLARKKIIQQEDIPKIESLSRQNRQPLEDLLLKMGVDESSILEAKGEYLNVPTRVIDEKTVMFSVLKYIPEESAVHYAFAPIGLVDGVLEVGFVDPDNIEARDALNFISSKVGLPYKIFLISKSDFDKILKNYKGISSEVTEALQEFGGDLGGAVAGVEMTASSEGQALNVEEESTRIIEDAPVTKIVATILRYATEGNASDVHIEHMRDRIRVRFRVDGVLNTSLILPPTVHQAVVARIKILSNMKLDEKRKPQDGRFSAKIEGRKIDFRVSTFPAYFGEKVVMRILDQEKGVKPLIEMIDDPEMYKAIKEAIDRPYGLILISGPTGSGKTTTLYSMLNEINKDELNVLSLEDPIEYNIDGMSQSQVFPEIGYDFASGLRTTLRQDPDVIMVGEIRDKETARLAVQAALTGHLVLSTIHTNSSVGVIPRLIDMGVDPYLIAPTLIMAMAQRLVRNIYPGTGKKVVLDGSLRASIEKEFADLPAEYRNKIKIPESVLEIEPSPESPTGTKGRSAAFEYFKMDRDVEQMILKNPTESGIYDILRKKGMLTMKENALMKAFKGQVPYEEVSRTFGLLEMDDTEVEA